MIKTLIWIRGLGQIFEIFEVSVPHDNKTGDAEFMKNYIFKNKFWKQVNTNSSTSFRAQWVLTLRTKVEMFRPSNHL